MAQDTVEAKHQNWFVFLQPRLIDLYAYHYLSLSSEIWYELLLSARTSTLLCNLDAVSGTYFRRTVSSDDTTASTMDTIKTYQEPS